MSALGQVRVGHKAPDFHCEAVVSGNIEDVSLSSYIRPSIEASTAGPHSPWLTLLFIPAAFSFVCPTEVLAFQNCLDEFKDRNCTVLFVSVDTKHSLWHWQNVPRQYGGLGSIDIPLLSDVNHRMSKDYGVLVEEEGVSLRGMFIIDAEGIVQQITLNNLTVGRSVLEALRLLEAFQAVAKHGVLCPIDWKPGENASDTISTISNTIMESYEGRLADLQKEFGGVQVTDLDAKHGHEDGEGSNMSNVGKNGEHSAPSFRPSRLDSSPQLITTVGPACKCQKSLSLHSNVKYDRAAQGNFSQTLITSNSSYDTRSASAPSSVNAMPAPTPSTNRPPPITRLLPASTARHSRGHASTPPTPSVRAKLPAAAFQLVAKHNTYESRRGSHVVLEFADPTASQKANPEPPLLLGLSTMPRSRSPSQSRSRTISPNSSRGTSHTGADGWVKKSPDPSKHEAASPATSGQTRLQATFEAIKKMSAGLASPRVDHSPQKKSGGKSSGTSEGSRAPGYFDVVIESVES